MSTTVADRIKVVLEEKGIDQADLAQATGVDPSTAYRWVEGERTPQRKNLQSIATAYGYNYTWLAKGKGPKLVEREDIPPNAAIVFYDAETQEVWATAELAFRVRIHKPMKIIGGKSGGGMRIDVDAE